MRRFICNWTLLVPCALLATLLGSPLIAADNAAVPADTVNLELNDIDVRSAVELLFRSTGKNFSIEPNVSGKITAISLQNVSFDSALKSLTKSNGLVYRIDGNVYIISKRAEVTEKPVYTEVYPSPEDDPQTPTTKTAIIEKVPLNYASASEIIYLLQQGSDGREYGGYGNNGMRSGYGNNNYGGYSNNNYGGYNNSSSYGRNSGSYGNNNYSNNNSNYNSYGNRNYNNSSNSGYRGWQ